MKRTFVLLVGILIASLGYAQVDSATIQRQQEELMRQQQLEQQQLMEQQQKEQERLEKEQLKAQEAEQKAQQKAQEKELKDQAKEQAKEQAALQAKQEKQLKKAERRESITRNVYFSLDPYFGYNVNTNFLNKRDPYHSGSMFWRGYRGDFLVGGDVDLHIPLRKHLNLDFGVGYGLNRYAYTNEIDYDAANNTIVTCANADAFEVQYNGYAHHLEVPLMLSFTGKDSTWNETYLGVRVGYTFKGTYRERSWDASNNVQLTPDVDMLKCFNQYQLKIVFGHQTKAFIFSPGWEIYFNVLPTYVDQSTSVREIGFLYKF